MICGHGHEQKFRYPYPRDSKKIQMPYPRAKAIDENPALCPASPPCRLDIDRCINNKGQTTTPETFCPSLYDKRVSSFCPLLAVTSQDAGDGANGLK